MSDKKKDAFTADVALEAYWEAARAGRLLLKKCGACGKTHYYPRRTVHPAPVLASRFPGARVMPAVQCQGEWQTRGRLHGKGVRRAGS